MDNKLPVDRQNLNQPFVRYVELGKPVLSPLARRAVRLADDNAGRGGWKKRTPARNRLDRSSKFAPSRR
ncbi:hypothetical protein DSP73_22130 [Salmonella enterica]|nr:hypothetical protein [Salmonella enterica]ECN5820156.1 hypothetical protein [Salmonella enterica subsp. enterica serovar Infantis]EDW6858905.1 hypothetical protein [Salmonella enterica]EEJ5734719.1 hypothetical protein [Salmonella enterica]